MANPIKGYYSDLVLGKVDSSDQGYSFAEVGIAFADTLEAGMLVKADGTLVAASDAAADVFGVIVDRELQEAYDFSQPLTAGTKYNFVVGVRGLTLNKARLKVADGSAAPATLLAALEGKGIKVTDKYLDGTVDIPVTSI